MPIHTGGRHFESPIYVENIQQWKFLRASYLGGRVWYEQGQTHDPFVGFWQFTRGDNVHHEEEFAVTELSYLWRHQRERDEFYRLRFRSSVYWNFVRPAVDAIAAAVAKATNDPQLPPEINFLHTDVDQRGTDLSDFDRAVIAWMLVYGHINVLVDKPIAEHEPASLAEEREQGLLPFAQIVSPLDLVRWNWDAQASVYRWALIRERTPLDLVPIIDGSQETAQHHGRFRFRLWKPDEWVLFNGEGTVLMRGPGFGFVPLVPGIVHKDPQQPEPIGVSMIEDVAELAKLVYNKFSWLTEEERMHAFNQLFIKGKEGMTEDQARILGSSTYIGGAEDAKYLAPDVSPMDHMEQSIQNDVEKRAYSMLNIRSAEQAAGVKSGIALQLERETTDAMLAGVAKAFEGVKRTWLRMAAVMAGGNPEEVEVKVGRDFTTLTRQGTTEALMSAIEKGEFSGTAKIALQKELWKGLLPDVADDVRDEVFREMDQEMEETKEGPVDDSEQPTEATQGAPEADGTEETALVKREQETGVEGLDSAAPVPASSAMNGAQITALKDIVLAVGEGVLPRESALGLIMASFPLTQEQAEAVLGPIGTPEFEPTKPEPPAGPFGGNSEDEPFTVQGK